MSNTQLIIAAGVVGFAGYSLAHRLPLSPLGVTILHMIATFLGLGLLVTALTR